MKTSKHPKLTNGQPAISCLNLNATELYRRVNAAHDKADKLVAALPCELAGEDLVSEAIRISRHILWHADFADGLRLWVCDNQLFRLVADLPSQLQEANNEQRLDFYDYGYVADVLRELLTEYGLPKGDRLCLKRALAWVEERGSGLRDFSQE
jgi:hypothetical protein